MAEHVYIAPTASSFRVTVTVEGVRTLVQFVSGSYRTEDANLAKALDERIESGASRGMMRKVDRAAAEALVAQHRELREGTGAHAGQMTTAQNANLNALQARDQELHNQPNADEIAAQQKESNNLLMTEDSSLPDAKAVTPDEKPAGIKLGGG